MARPQPAPRGWGLRGKAPRVGAGLLAEPRGGIGVEGRHCQPRPSVISPPPCPLGPCARRGTAAGPSVPTWGLSWRGAGAPQRGYEPSFGATNHNPKPPPPHTHTPKPSGGAHPGAEALKFLFPRSTPPRCRAACPPRRRRGISQPSPDRIKEKYTSKQNRGLLTPDGAAKGAEASPRPGRPGW